MPLSKAPSENHGKEQEKRVEAEQKRVEAERKRKEEIIQQQKRPTRIQRTEAPEDGLPVSAPNTWNKSPTTLMLPGAYREPKAAAEGQMEKEYNIDWEGNRIYEQSGRCFRDLLTITRISQSCYVAQSVSEYLQDLDPTKGPIIIRWLEEICRKSSDWTDSPRSHPTDLLITEQETKIEGTGGASRFSGMPSNNESSLTLSGYLHGTELKFRIKSESDKLIEEVECVLGWLLTALQVLEDNAEGLYLSICERGTLEKGLDKPVKFTPEEPQSCCWTSLFSSALVVDQTRLKAPTGLQRSGLEMDLTLLQELAGVDREMKTDYGIIQYGFDTAIFPIEPTDERKWHVVVTRGKQITPLRLKNALLGATDGRRVRMAQSFSPGKVYVGWCPHFTITFYANTYNTLRDPDNPFPSSGLPILDNNFQHTERTLARDSSVNIRGGLFAFLGGSTGIKREKKYKQSIVRYRKVQGKDQNFHDVLLAATRTPCILWTDRQKEAWLLRGVSVSLYACIAYTQLQQCSFHLKQNNGKFADAEMDIPDFVADLGEAASDILRRNASLVVKSINGFQAADGKPFSDIFRDIWEDMCCADDLCRTDSGKRLEEGKHLCGYDLSEVIYKKPFHVRKLKFLNAMKCWKPLADLEDAQVIFCQSMENVITSGCNTTSHSGGDSTLHLSGSLRCLFRDFKGLYGHRWSIESGRLITSSSGGVPIGLMHQWTPNRVKTINGEIDRDTCLQLQSIVPFAEKASSKLKKRSNDSQSREPSNNGAFALPSEQILMIFGQPAEPTFGKRS